MDVQLNPIEERILGCLIEKEMATPEYYPLTLNALVNACNQKSNRSPVMTLDESTVENALLELRMTHKLAIEVTSTGSRAPKYKHNFSHHWQFSPAKMAIVCELLLRGPQTPGDLRAHASRLHPLADAREVEEILQGLASREDGPVVVHLPREPGKRERRWAQLFGGDVQLQEENPELRPSAENENPSADRLQQLENEVAGLRQELGELKAQFETFKNG
ncbi:MAG: YceH family protein [Pontiella sp.]|nr:YceH family protein [Pontiella sp.]